MKIVNEERDAQAILEDGLNCEINVTVSEVVECLMDIYKILPNSPLLQRFKQNLGEDLESDIDSFVISLLFSEIATITETFKRRDKYTGKA